MEKTNTLPRPLAIVYADDPHTTIAWQCPRESCHHVYVIAMCVDAFTMARYCCNHLCLKCGAPTENYYVLCEQHRAEGEARLASKVRVASPTTTFTAPNGGIGAIGEPESEKDEPKDDDGNPEGKLSS